MEWKLEYIPVIFCVLVGTVYQFIFATAGDRYTVSQRIVSLIAAFVLVTLICVGIGMVLLDTHFVWACIWGLLLGIVGERALRLWMIDMNRANSIWKLARKLKRAWDIAEKMDENNDGNIRSD